MSEQLRIKLPDPEIYRSYEAKNPGSALNSELINREINPEPSPASRDHEAVAYEVAHAIKPDIDAVAELRQEKQAHNPLATAAYQINSDGSRGGMIGVKGYEGESKLRATEADLEKNSRYATEIAAKEQLGDGALLYFESNDKDHGLESIAASSSRHSISEIEAKIASEQLESRDHRIQQIVDKEQYDPRGESLVKRAGLRLLGKKALSASDVELLEADYVGPRQFADYKEHGIDRTPVTKEQEKADASKEIIRANLDHFRIQLAGFDELQSSQLERMLSKNSELSPFIQSLKPEDMSWTSWLSDESRGATDNQLLNVMQWHTDYIDRINSRNTERYAGVLKDEYYLDVQDAVQQGNLPSEALEKIKNVYDVPIEFVSIFDAARQGTRPHHQVYSGKVRLWDTADQDTANHELNHAAMGDLINGDEEGNRWLNEAVTEYIAAVIGGKDPTKLVWEDDSNYYRQERTAAMALILAAGLQPRDLAKAYMDTENGYQHLSEKIEQALGYDALREVAKQIGEFHADKRNTLLMARANEELFLHDMSKKWISEIGRTPV